MTATVRTSTNNRFVVECLKVGTEDSHFSLDNRGVCAAHLVFRGHPVCITGSEFLLLFAKEQSGKPTGAGGGQDHEPRPTPTGLARRALPWRALKYGFTYGTRVLR